MSEDEEAGPLTQAVLTEEEIEAANAMVARIEHLAQLASSLQVRLMIDAEQTYFQPAIDNTVLHLQERHNRDAYTIFNTYVRGRHHRTTTHSTTSRGGHIATAPIKSSKLTPACAVHTTF